MAAPNPDLVERQMYVNLVLNGVDDPSLTLAELRGRTGGGVNAARAASAANAESNTGGSGGSGSSITFSDNGNGYINASGGTSSDLQNGYSTLA